VPAVISILCFRPARTKKNTQDTIYTKGLKLAFMTEQLKSIKKTKTYLYIV